MAFAVKDWKDYPDLSTPISSAALKDIETRLSAYTDQQVAASPASIQNVAYSAAITPDASAGGTIKVGTLTGNITVNAPVHSTSGQTLRIIFTQDATGGRTITWNGVFKFPVGFSISTSANAVNVVEFVYDGSVWDEIGAGGGASGGYQSVAYAASITPDASNGSTIGVGALTGDITINAPTGGTAGQTLRFIFTQDGTGGRTITWNSAFKVTDANFSKGPSQVTTIEFVYDGTNWRQLAQISRAASGVFNVTDFGALCDGSTDDTAAAQRALTAAGTAGGTIVLFPIGTCVVTSALSIPSNVIVSGLGEGSIVKRDGVGGSGTKVFVNSDTAAFGNNTGIKLVNLRIKRTSGTSNNPYDNCIHMRAVDGLVIEGVHVTGGGKAILVEGCSNFRVVNNQVDGFQDNGISINWAEGYGASAVVDPEGVVANNTIRQTAATKNAAGSSPLLCSLPNTVIANNTIISTTSLSGYCVELGDTADQVIVSGNSIVGGGILVGDGDYVSIVGNTLTDGSVTGSAQINVVNNTGAPVGTSITGNKLRCVATSAFPAIKVQTTTTFATIKGNTVHGGAAIWCLADDSEVVGNTVIGAFHEGFQLKTGARMVIRGNTARNCGTDAAGSATTKIGFLFDTLTDPTIEDNTAVSSLAATSDMKNGYYVNASTNIRWRNNISRGHTTGIVTTTGTQTWFYGSSQSNLASASDLVVPLFADTFRVTGTTQIDTVNVTGQAGRTVTLIFGATCTLKNGGNQALAGAADFVATLSDAITLVCNGATWFEVSRSVN